MSEYWVSKKKYFCKYCDIFIADDAPSRQQHENGLRHQGNKARFVRDLYKTSERKKKDLDEEKRDMIKVEKAAAEAYARDLGLDPTTAAASVASTSSSRPKPPPTPVSTDRYSNYTTAESLGFVDEDALKAAAERELHKNQGTAGAWTPVPVQLPATVATLNQSVAAASSSSSSASASTSTFTPPAQTTTFEDPDDVRGWRLDQPDAKRRRIAIGMGNVYNPGKLNVIRKEGAAKKEEEEAQAAAVQVAQQAKEEEAQAPLNWTPKTWKKAGESSASASKSAVTASGADGEVKKQEPSEDASTPLAAASSELNDKIITKAENPSLVMLPADAEHLVKTEEADAPVPAPVDTPEEVPAAGLFRKRKHAGAARSSRK